MYILSLKRLWRDAWQRLTMVGTRHVTMHVGDIHHVEPSLSHRASQSSKVAWAHGPRGPSALLLCSYQFVGLRIRCLGFRNTVSQILLRPLDLHGNKVPSVKNIDFSTWCPSPQVVIGTTWGTSSTVLVGSSKSFCLSLLCFFYFIYAHAWHNCGFWVFKKCFY